MSDLEQYQSVKSELEDMLRGMPYSNHENMPIYEFLKSRVNEGGAARLKLGRDEVVVGRVPPMAGYPCDSVVAINGRGGMYAVFDVSRGSEADEQRRLLLQYVTLAAVQRKNFVPVQGKDHKTALEFLSEMAETAMTLPDSPLRSADARRIYNEIIEKADGEPLHTVEHAGKRYLFGVAHEFEGRDGREIPYLLGLDGNGNPDGTMNRTSLAPFTDKLTSLLTNKSDDSRRGLVRRPKEALSL